ncbi:acyl-CoA carboxylase epsilon subunit [Amycolatopsis sp. NPDC049688]|uniref:acyl-CoA carboxylase epsilon subunit n=1 Tax=Amycolatopsis sp. NPDC049688 TaxID=3154733 RepID=UPI00342F4C0D
MSEELVLVVRGGADEVSLAALVAVLAGLAGRSSGPSLPERSGWAGEAWGNGPGAWRRSALPR